MGKKSSAGIILILAFAVVATIGSPTVGIHQECKSGSVDSDGDGFAGMLDPQCAEYPFEDGNGQSDTPENERRTEANGYNFGTSSATNEAEYFFLEAYQQGLSNQDICNTYFALGTPPEQTIDWYSSTQSDASNYFLFWTLSLPQFPITC
jgi:hypothetical protein